MKCDPTKWMTDELPKIDAFFAEISGILEKFAKRHNLLIEKYLHRRPAWSFFFRHPKGGGAVIEVNKWGNEKVKVGAAWWLDNYEKLQSRSKFSKRKMAQLNSLAIIDAMEQTLAQIVSWNEEDLKVIPHVFHGWKEVGKAKLEKELERYPIPKI